MHRVLVVDDDPDMLDLVSFCLKRAGHLVTSMSDPHRALGVAQEAAFDLFVLDWSMPGMNGGQLCARIRELPGQAGTAVLILTAHADEATRGRAREAGATDFMTKPFTLAGLSGRAAELLGDVSVQPAGGSAQLPDGTGGPP